VLPAADHGTNAIQNSIIIAVNECEQSVWLAVTERNRLLKLLQML